MTTTAHEAFRRVTRFGSLDGLRCLAIVPVVWHHATPRPEDGVLGRGPLGVDLFFVISGFLITTLLLRERDRLGRIDLVGFYRRRAFRIFPLYFAVLGLYLVRALLRDPGDPIRTHFMESLPLYATYTANWLVRFDVGHPVAFGFAWSLSTEEQFYAVWPFVLGGVGLAAAWLGGRRPGGASHPPRALSRLVPLLVPGLVALGLVALDQCVESGGLRGALPEGSLSRRIVASIATPIGLGAAAALIAHHPRGFSAVHRVVGSRAAAPIALATLFACVAAPVPLFPTQVAMTVLVLAATLREDHGLAPLLRAGPIARIGVTSYGIYLLHVSCVVGARSVLGEGAATWSVFAVAWLATWAMAELSFRYFEQPLLARGRAPRSRRPALSLGG